ncbi:MAG: phytoene desaturase [Bacteroidetes bacterium]|nr:phytoene desaturase [Bacteroidota bacterium]
MNRSGAKHIVVLGAGLAGLAVSIRLRQAGFRVTVIEKNATYGGMMTDFSEKGYRWDKGPSFFSMPAELDEIFELCGENPREHLKYKKHDISCTYYFKDKSVVRFWNDQEKLKHELIAGFNADAAYKTMTYLERSRETYKLIGDSFIDHPLVGLKDLFRRDLLLRYPHFLTAKMRKTLHQYNHAALKDPKLVQIFDRFGTDNGSSPYKMSGLYSMIPHLEQNTGTFFPVNGMRDLADSLYHLAFLRGVEFRFEETIESVKLLQQGYLLKSASSEWRPDKLVCAMDHLLFYRDLLKDERKYNRYVKQERSSSGLVFYWGIKEAVAELGLHTILFSEDYRAEFEQIFDAGKLPDDPTIYIHISAAVNPSDAPEGGQNWFVMVNSPAGKQPTPEEIAGIRKKILDRIQLQFNIDLGPRIVCEYCRDAKSFERETGSFMGALYGASSNGKLAALKRHGNKSRKYPNLYFCGGTVHPGGGIPLVLKSAKIVAQLIQREL